MALPTPNKTPQEEQDILKYQKTLSELKSINDSREKLIVDDVKSRVKSLNEEKRLLEEQRKIRAQELADKKKYIVSQRKMLADGTMSSANVKSNVVTPATPIVVEGKFSEDTAKYTRLLYENEIKKSVEYKRENKLIDARNREVQKQNRDEKKISEIRNTQYQKQRRDERNLSAIRSKEQQNQQKSISGGGEVVSKSKSSKELISSIRSIRHIVSAPMIIMALSKVKWIKNIIYNIGDSFIKAINRFTKVFNDKTKSQIGPINLIDRESSEEKVLERLTQIRDILKGKIAADERNRKVDEIRNRESSEEQTRNPISKKISDGVDTSKESKKEDSGLLENLFGNVLGEYLGNKSLKKGLIKNILSVAVGGISNLATNLAKIIFNPLTGLIAGGVWAIMDGIKGMFKFGGVSGFIGGLFGGLDSGVKGMFSGAGKWALIGAGIGSFIPGIGTIIGGVIGALFGGILGFFGGEKISKAIKGYWKFLGDIFGKLFDGIKRIGKFVWDYSPLGMLFNTMKKVVDWFKGQEGDSIFEKIKNGLGNVKAGIGKWLLGIIPDIFGLGWLRKKVADIFGVSVSGSGSKSDSKSTNDKSTNDKSTNDKSTNDKSTNDKSTNDKSTNDKSTNIDGSISTENSKEQKKQKDKEQKDNEKKKIGLSSKQVSWLKSINEGIADLVKSFKKNVFDTGINLGESAQITGDTIHDMIQDMGSSIGRSFEGFKDRFIPSESQQNQKSLIVDELKKSGITDPNAIANILATNKAESRLKPQSESMKYSAKRLMEVFPNRFKSYADAKKVADSGEQGIAEHLYGAESKKGKELGNTERGDGWKYRGRGLNQLTGKANYKKYGDLIGVDLVKNPDLTNDPKIAAKINAAYYKDRSKGDLSKLNSMQKVSSMTGYFSEQEKQHRLSLAQQEKQSADFASGYAGTASSVGTSGQRVSSAETKVANQKASQRSGAGVGIVNAPSTVNNSSSNTTVVAGGRPAYRNTIDDYSLQKANGDMTCAIS